MNSSWFTICNLLCLFFSVFRLTNVLCIELPNQAPMSYVQFEQATENVNNHLSTCMLYANNVNETTEQVEKKFAHFLKTAELVEEYAAIAEGEQAKPATFLLAKDPYYSLKYAFCMHLLRLTIITLGASNKKEEKQEANNLAKILFTRHSPVMNRYFNAIATKNNDPSGRSLDHKKIKDHAMTIALIFPFVKQKATANSNTEITSSSLLTAIVEKAGEMIPILEEIPTKDIINHPALVTFLFNDYVTHIMYGAIRAREEFKKGNGNGNKYDFCTNPNAVQQNPKIDENGKIVEEPIVSFNAHLFPYTAEVANGFFLSTNYAGNYYDIYRKKIPITIKDEHFIIKHPTDEKKNLDYKDLIPLQQLLHSVNSCFYSDQMTERLLPKHSNNIKEVLYKKFFPALWSIKYKKELLEEPYNLSDEENRIKELGRKFVQTFITLNAAVTINNKAYLEDTSWFYYLQYVSVLNPLLLFYSSNPTHNPLKSFDNDTTARKTLNFMIRHYYGPEAPLMYPSTKEDEPNNYQKKNDMDFDEQEMKAKAEEEVAAMKEQNKKTTEF